MGHLCSGVTSHTGDIPLIRRHTSHAVKPLIRGHTSIHVKPLIRGHLSYRGHTSDQGTSLYIPSYRGHLHIMGLKPLHSDYTPS